MSENEKEKTKKAIYKKWWFWLIAILLFMGFVEMFSTDSTNSSNTVSTTAINQQNTGETEEERNARLAAEVAAKEEEMKNFKASCEKFTYKEIARNPKNYENKNIQFTGKVEQVQENSSLFSSTKSIVIRLAVTKDKYGYYDDYVYCTYNYSENESKILEDDIITVYGVCTGDYTYTTVLGSSVTIPSIDVKYITLENSN